MGYLVAIEPSEEPVTVAECKLIARFTSTALDDLIEGSFIPAARRACEQRVGRSLITQTIKKTLDAWPEAFDIELQRGPVQSIEWIRYLDSDGTQQTVSTSIYSLDNLDSAREAWALLKTGEAWPSAGNFANAISVLYVAGYGGSADDVPRELRIWVMAAVAEMIRTGSLEIPAGFCAGLLDRETIVGA